MQEEQKNIVFLSEQILKSNNEESYNSFAQIICNPQMIHKCLQAIDQSDAFIFVYSNMMIKLLENRQLVIYDKNLNEDQLKQRQDIFGKILIVMASQLQEKQRQQKKSIINFIGVLLKNLLQVPGKQQHLFKIINFFLPSYTIEDNIKNQLDLRQIQMKNLDYNCMNSYEKLTKIFICMFQQMLQLNCSQNYDKFRKYLQNFRQFYLSYFLKFSVEHLKFFFTNINYGILINPTIQILSCMFTYPVQFSLWLIDPDNQKIQNIIQERCDIHYPAYFLHVICDQKFVGNLLQYFLLIVNNTTNYSHSEKVLINLLNILGRINCPTPFIYDQSNKYEKQKQNVIMRGFSILQSICLNFRFIGQQYLLTIVNIIQIFLHNKEFVKLKTKIRQFIPIAIQFFKKVINQSQILISEGQHNPLNKVVKFFKSIITLKTYKQRLQQYEQILQCIFNKLFSQQQAKKIVQSYDFLSCTEMEDFSIFFNKIMQLFEYNLQSHMNKLLNLKINNFNNYAQIILLHFYSFIINTTSIELSINIDFILKCCKIAQNLIKLNIRSIAPFRYIALITLRIMQEMNIENQKQMRWMLVLQHASIDFHAFIKQIINLCLVCFNNNNNQIVQKSFTFFKIIFKKIKYNDSDKFNQYQQIAHSILNKIQLGQLFIQGQVLQKRRKFYGIASLILLGQSSSQETILDFYSKIKYNINQNLFKEYLYELTGIIQSIFVKKPFQIILNLCLDDLAILFKNLMQNVMGQPFEDAVFVKIICKLSQCLTQNLKDNLTQENYQFFSSKIYSVIFPYVQKLMRKDLKISQNLVEILINMAKLNSTAKLINFQPIIPQMKKKYCQKLNQLIQVYFLNIRRVDSLGWMYRLIGQNIDFLVNWCQEKIFRQQSPKIRLRQILQSKFWKNQQERMKLMGLIKKVNLQNSSYWDITQSAQLMKEFENSFSSMINLECEKSQSRNYFECEDSYKLYDQSWMKKT